MNIKYQIVSELLEDINYRAPCGIIIDNAEEEKDEELSKEEKEKPNLNS